MLMTNMGPRGLGPWALWAQGPGPKQKGITTKKHNNKRHNNNNNNISQTKT